MTGQVRSTVNRHRCLAIVGSPNGHHQRAATRVATIPILRLLTHFKRNGERRNLDPRSRLIALNVLKSLPFHH